MALHSLDVAKHYYYTADVHDVGCRAARAGVARRPPSPAAAEGLGCQASSRCPRGREQRTRGAPVERRLRGLSSYSPFPSRRRGVSSEGRPRSLS